MTREYHKSGIHRKGLRRARGLAAVNRKTVEGKIALSWRDAALRAKGGANYPTFIKQEIAQATFDLYRLALLQTFIIADANNRGTIVNRRKRELSRIHEQYDQIDARFMRRCELLKLDQARPAMSARERLAEAIKQQNGNGKSSEVNP